MLGFVSEQSRWSHMGSAFARFASRATLMGSIQWWGRSFLSVRCFKEEKSLRLCPEEATIVSDIAFIINNFFVQILHQPSIARFG